MRDGSGARVKGVEVDGAVVEGDAVVIAMGPWSILAAQWLPLPPVFGLKGHSLVFETGARVPAEALFLEYQEASGEVHGPEVFPRTDGTTYVCAISSESPLPVDPADVAPDPGAIDRLQAMCARLSPTLGRAKVLARQACHRPVTQDGLPLIGANCRPRRGLRRHRPQRLGYPQRARNRRGNCRVDRGRRRSHASTSRPSIPPAWLRSIRTLRGPKGGEALVAYEQRGGLVIDARSPATRRQRLDAEQSAAAGAALSAGGAGSGNDPAAAFEELFDRNGWPRAVAQRRLSLSPLPLQRA